MTGEAVAAHRASAARVAARLVVTPDGIIGPVAIEIDEGGLIRQIAPVANAPDRTILPGFVDIQVNGIDDIDVAHARGADWDRLDDLLLDQGTTTWLPTLVTAPLERYPARLERIAEAAARPPNVRPSIAGAHLEGPFLGAAPGAHRPDWIRPIDLAWLAALPPVVRMVTLCPQDPLAADAARLLVSRGITVSLGHSRADAAQAARVVDAGATAITHLFNAMGALHHRHPGIAAVALTDDRLSVGLIADGVHVHPTMLRLAVAAKGAGRIVLVTDAVAWRAGTAGEIRLALDADGAPRLADGTLAGSALAMPTAVRRLVVECGSSLPDAAAAASTNPARLIGLADRGAIAVGQRADLVALNDAYAVQAVWLGGHRVR